jgi:hypothetical protein
MKMENMSKEDWIILRMIFVAVGMSPRVRTEPDVVRAIVHLHRKYGTDTVLACIDMLWDERGFR